MNNNKFLKLVSKETLVLDAVDGSRTFENEEKVCWLDYNFKNLNAIEAGTATPKTEIQIYELTQPANFAMIFGSFNQDPEPLCFTQDQILNFTEKYKSWIQRDPLFSTFLLFKANGKFYVCDVPFLVKDLWISIDQFGAIHRWNAEDRRQFAIPKLGIQKMK